MSLTDAMPSWNESKAKDAILTFVEQVTTKGSPNFIAPSERIAVFDNDGTLCAEQPIYIQLAFAIDRLKALAARHPEWEKNELLASLLDGDVKHALSRGERAAAEIVAVAHAGMTADEFRTSVREWRRTARHPSLKRRYTELVYQPMLELLRYLRANGFKTYIVTGGGVEFVRTWAEDVCGVPPEHVVGSAGRQRFEVGAGGPAFVHLPAVDYLDDNAGKPVGIQRFIGRRPIAAFGNSDGDHEMLQWTAAGGDARLMLLVHHNDAEREWAYDRDSHVGRLDKALDDARAKDWAIVSMKDDWNKVFVNRARYGV